MDRGGGFLPFSSIVNHFEPFLNHVLRGFVGLRAASGSSSSVSSSDSSSSPHAQDVLWILLPHPPPSYSYSSRPTCGAENRRAPGGWVDFRAQWAKFLLLDPQTELEKAAPH